MMTYLSLLGRDFSQDFEKYSGSFLNCVGSA
jgi:hypothetical protein